MTRPRSPRPRGVRLLVTLVTLGLVAGVGGGLTYAAFFDTTSTGGNSFNAANDLTAPTVVRSEIQQNGTGYLSGVIAQGASYRAYAQVTDSGNPASGVNTVTADLSNVTTGGGSVAMTSAGGPWTVAGVSYNYRTALQTAKNPLANGTYTYTVTATDGAGNSSGATSFSVRVDSTAPAPSDIQIVNGAGTVSKPDAGDVVTFTYTEQMEPTTILAGWNGTSTAVRVRLANGGCGANDSLTVQSPGGATLPLTGATQACLGRSDYVNGNRTFTTSSMVQSGSAIVVTLGGAPLTLTAAGSGTLTWTSNAAVTDIAGNACTVATVTESGALDRDF